MFVRRIPSSAVAIGLATLILAALSGPALAAEPGPGPASGWHVGYYTSSGKTLSFAEAPASPGGVASLNFTSASNTALLVTDQKAQNPSLLGDLSGAAGIAASGTVSGVTGSFTYGGEPSCGGTTAFVRFFFRTSAAGGFNETQYWWSNPVMVTLANGSWGPITDSFAGSNWSDFFGHFGNDPAYAAGFAAALSDVTEIGLSFGGGCFFENGVGTTDGSGTFILGTFSVS